MKAYLLRLLSLFAGLFLFAWGIVITIQANIGYAPWEVFHAGLALQTSMSIGTVSILVGLFFLFVVIWLREKIGIGTIANMILIGLFVDLIISWALIPLNHSFFSGVVMLFVGFFIIALGSYHYIKSAFGSGPRDSLMVALNRKTKLPIGFCRLAIELTATIMGWLLGGQIGLGTLIAVIASGFCVQLVFSCLRFDAAAVKHETLGETVRRVKPKK